VIGCPDAARVADLKRAIAAACPLAVAQAWPLEQALAAGSNADTAVVILERFPSSLALRTMADVTTARPELGVLVLGPLAPNTEALIALASGAAGYLPSGSSPTAVAHAVETLLAGEMVLPRTVWLPLVHDLRWRGRGVVVTGINGQPAELRNREWEVLVLLRQAHSTAEIARCLSTTNATVRSHVMALLHKLGAHDRATLTG
jgi:DNA-binding NarL/FixJ family response regulator